MSLTFGTILGGGLAALAGGALNNTMSFGLSSASRKENYELNEKAAANADKRTRALYQDLQSPSALLQQYKDAGLSPSIMMSGGAQGSVPQGAQSEGVSGVNAQPFGVSMLEAAQLAKTNAETKNIEADTANKEQDNIKKQAETKIKQYEESVKSNEMRIMFTGLQKDGKNYSLYELANDEYDFNDYLKKVREFGSEGYNTQASIDILRNIYFANKRDKTEIATLANDKVNAVFHEQLAEFMLANDVPSLTGKEAATKLRAKIDANNLNEEQQKAWNKLLKGLEDKSGDKTKTAAILIGLILNNALTNWNPQNIF